MKTDFEMYQSVLSKREEYRKKKERRMLTIKRTVPLSVCLCLAAVVGIKYRNYAERIPQIPIVTEITTTAGTAAIVTTAAETENTITTQTISVKNTSVTVTKTETSAPKASLTETVKTTISETLQSAEKSVITETETSRNIIQTSNITTGKQTAVFNTSVISTTAAESQTTSSDTGDSGYSGLSGDDAAFTGTMDIQKPDVRTTAEQQGPSMKPSTETEVTEKPAEVKNINSFSFQGITYRNHYMTVDRSELTEIFTTEPAAVYDNIEGKDKTVPLRMFRIKNISDKIAVAVRNENDGYLLYTSDYIPETMQTLFDNISLSDWKIYSITYCGNQITGFDDKAIFDAMLSLPDTADSFIEATGKVLIIIMNHDILGTRRILLTEYGDLICDQAGFGLAYHVGEDNINKIKELIL